MAGFIDSYSAKCMLGPVSKNYHELNNLFSWQVGNKYHFVMINDELITSEHINYLQQLKSASFHYLNDTNVKILKTVTKPDSKKEKSIILSINEINYSGNKNKTIRNYYNRYKGYDIRDNFGNISEVKMMLNKWSITLGDKYFRDFSGKNRFFLEKGNHLNCENVFVYNNNELISFGVASPVVNGDCSYVIGKALATDYPGLSEFTDMQLYQKLHSKYGSFRINMGQANKGLLFYKKKFPNSTEVVHFNGKITF